MEFQTLFNTLLLAFIAHTSIVVTGLITKSSKRISLYTANKRENFIKTEISSTFSYHSSLNSGADGAAGSTVAADIQEENDLKLLEVNNRKKKVNNSFK